MMTKRDYELLAKALNSSRHIYAGDPVVFASKMNQWNATATFIASALGVDNTKFNRAKFLAACGCESE